MYTYIHIHEAVRVVFDPAVVTYGELLAIFWDHIGRRYFYYYYYYH